MTTIEQAIAQAMKTLTSAVPQERRVSDEQVAAKIAELASVGYAPSLAVADAVRDYLSGYGLLLNGEAGAGKTFLMSCLNVRIYTCEAIADYGLARLHLWHSWVDGYEICIDDLGAEHAVAEYGAKDDLLKSVLAHRLDAQKGRTHITTNLSAEQISERYGDRVLSRILGLCKPHTLEGGNRRAARVYPPMEEPI